MCFENGEVTLYVFKDEMTVFGNGLQRTLRRLTDRNNCGRYIINIQDNETIFLISS